MARASVAGAPSARIAPAVPRQSRGDALSPSPGGRLGPYAIVAPLGAGGMGEVYRATDTKLDREVAIKVLPEALMADAERMARFEREAKLLASLNHPNVAAIVGLSLPLVGVS